MAWRESVATAGALEPAYAPRNLNIGKACVKAGLVFGEDFAEYSSYLFISPIGSKIISSY